MNNPKRLLFFLTALALAAGLGAAGPGNGAYAQLVLNKQASRASASPGDVMTYTLTLSNNAPVPETAVVVQDPFVTGAPAPDAFVVGSVAAFDANTGQPVGVTNQYQTAVNGPYGNYTPVADARGTDTNVDGVQWTLAGPMPGKSAIVFRFQVYINTQPNYPTTITNQASVTSANQNKTSNPVNTLVPGPGGVSITKRSDKQVILPGDTYHYTISLSNPTAAPVNGNLQDALPPGVAEIPGTMTLSINGAPTPLPVADNPPPPSAAAQALQNGTFPINLPAAAGVPGTAQLSFEVQTSNQVIQPGTDIRNTATFTAPGVQVSDTSLTFAGQLLLVKTVDKSSGLPASNTAPASPGELLTYTLTFANYTDSSLLPDSPALPALAGIMDTLDPQEEFVVGSVSGPADAFYSTGGAGGPFNYIPKPGLNPEGADPAVNAIFFALRSLPAHTAASTITFQARIKAGAAGTVTNTAQGQGTVGDPAIPMYNTYTSPQTTATTAVSTEMLDKSVNKSAALAGDTLTYTLRVKGTVAGTVLHDTPAPSVTFVPGSFILDGTAQPDSSYAALTGPGYTPPAAGDHTINYTVTINANTPVGTVLQNVATRTDGGPVVQASSTVTVGAIKLVKTVDKGNVEPGGFLNYTIEIDNPTDTVLANPGGFTVSDAMPAGSAYVVGSAIAGPASGIAFTTGNVPGVVPTNYGPEASIGPNGVTAIRWTFNTLPARTGPIYLHFTVQVDRASAPATVINNVANGQATAAAAVTNSSSGVVSTVITPLEVHKTANRAQALPGDAVQYATTYTNISAGTPNPAPAPSELDFQDALSAGQTYVPGTLFIDGVAFDDAHAALFFSTGLQVTANQYPQLMPQPDGIPHTVTYEVVTAPGSLAGSVYTNQTFVRAVGNGFNGVIPSETTAVTVGKFDLAKAVDTAAAPTGQTVTYTVTIDNPTDTPLPTDSTQPNAPEGGALVFDPIDPALTNVTILGMPPGVTAYAYSTYTPPAAPGRLPTLSGGPTPVAPNTAVPPGTAAIAWRIADMPAHSGPYILRFTAQLGAPGAPDNRVGNQAWAQPAYPDVLSYARQAEIDGIPLLQEIARDNRPEVLGGPTFSNPAFVTQLVNHLTFTKSHTPAGPQAFPGQTITYQLTPVVDDFSPDATVDYTIYDHIPSGVHFAGNAAYAPVVSGGGASPTVIRYSNDGGLSWSYVPAAGVDPRVTDIRFDVTLTKAGAAPFSLNGSAHFEVLVDPLDPDGTVISNTGIFTSDSATLGLAGASFPSNTDLVTVGAGGLLKTVNLPTAHQGDQLVYRLQYRTGVALPGQVFYVEDAVPAGTFFLVNSPRPLASAQYSTDNGATWTAVPKADATGVDQTITNVRWPVAANTSSQVSFAVRISKLAGDTQAVFNTALLQLQTGNAAPAILASSNAITDIVGTISLVKSADRTTVNPGGEISYSMQYSNSGPAVTNATVTDRVPDNSGYVVGSAFGGQNVEFLGASGNVIATPTPGAGAGNTDPTVKTIIWHLGNLSANASGSVGFSVGVINPAKPATPVPYGTVIQNQAVIETQSPSLEPRSSNIVKTTVWPIQMTKMVDQPAAPPGATLNYSINFQEASGVTASTFTIQDAVPGDTTFVSAAPAVISGTSTAPEYSSDGGQTWNAAPTPNAASVTNLRWVIPGGLASAANGTASFQVTINANAVPGFRISNTAFENSTLGTTNPITGQPYRTPAGGIPSNTVTTVVSLVSLQKSVDLPFALPGEELQYRIVAHNNSGQALTNFQIVETVPPETLFVVGTVSPGPVTGTILVEYSTDGGATWSTTPPTPDANGVANVNPGPVMIRWTFASFANEDPTKNQGPITVSFRVRIDDNTDPPGKPALKGDTISNVAHVSADQQPQVDSNQVTTTVTPYLFRKSVDKPTALPGDILGYKLRFENRDTAAISPSAIIVDPIPANTAFVVGTFNSPADIVNGSPVAPNLTNVVEYSHDGGLTWTTNAPTANANGVDPTVTHIRILVDAVNGGPAQQPFLAGETGDATFQVRINTTDSTVTPPTVAPPFNTVIINTGYLTYPVAGPPAAAASIPTNPAQTVISPLRLVKTVDKGNTVLPAAGAAPGSDTLTYTVTAINLIQSGDANLSVPLTNVVVSDPIPGGTAYIVGSAAPVQGGVTIAFSGDGGATYGYTPVGAAGALDPNVTNVEWTFDSIAPYQTSGNVASFQVRIQPPAGNATGTGLQIDNIATGTGTYQAGGTPQPAAIQVGPVESNEVTTNVGTTYFNKTVNRPVFVTPGDVLTYTLLFENFGAAPLAQAIVTDTLPAGLVIETATSNPAGPPPIISTVPNKSNTVTFQFGAVPAGQAYRLEITALIPSNTPIGTEFDNTGELSYTGLLENMQSNTTRNIVVSSVAGGDVHDWSMFQHEQMHSGLDPDAPMPSLTQQWIFNGASQNTASFVASPVVVRNVPLSDIDDNQNPNSVNIDRRTLEFIGATDGNFYAILADNQSTYTSALWNVQFEQPIESTAAVAEGPIGASPVFDPNGYASKITGITYQARTRWLVVFGLGSVNAPQTPGAVECLDASTGAEVWRFDGLGGAVVGSPIIVSGVSAHMEFMNPADTTKALPAQAIISVVYVPCSDGFIYAFSLSGELLPGTDDTVIQPQLLWRTRNTSGMNLGSVGAIGTTGVVFTEQQPVKNRTDAFTDYLHAVTSDASTTTVGTVVWPADAAGKPANPYAVSANGAAAPDYAVPNDMPGWTLGPQPGLSVPISDPNISNGTDFSVITQSPMVDMSSPVGAVIDIADEDQVLAIDANTGKQAANFRLAGLGITSTVALARLPDPANVTNPPLDMLFFSANTPVGKNFENDLYALTFTAANGLVEKWNRKMDAPPTNPALPALPPHGGVYSVTSSVAVAADPNGGGTVYAATNTNTITGGYVVSYEAVNGGFNGPLATTLGPPAQYLPYLLSSSGDAVNPNAQASLAVAVVPGAAGPWVFGATLGGTAFALGNTLIGGGLGGHGPPGIFVQKFVTNSTAANSTLPRNAIPVRMGDQLDYRIDFWNPGYASPATARANNARYEPLRGLVIVDNIPAGTSYVFGSATPIPVFDINLPGNPVRWIIPQIVMNRTGNVNKVVQVVWDFRNTVDIYGRRDLLPGDPQFVSGGVVGPNDPAGWYNLPGAELMEARFSVTVDSHINTVGNAGATVTVATDPAFNNLANTPFYGQRLYAKATGFTIDQAALNAMPNIQNTVAAYAVNATGPPGPDDPAARTIPDPDGPVPTSPFQGPSMPQGGLVQPPAPAPILPPLPAAPPTLDPLVVAPSPTNAPPLPGPYYPTGINPWTGSVFPTMYATDPLPVDKNATNAPVYFRMVRFNPARPAFVPTTPADLDLYQQVWEPADQRGDRGGPGFLRDATLTGPDNNGVYTAVPGLAARGRRLFVRPLYVIDTRNPNLYRAGQSGDTERNGALSPSPQIPNESYAIEVFASARPAVRKPGDMGWLGRSGSFGVANPLGVRTGTSTIPTLPPGERFDANGNLLSLPGTVIDAQSTAHGRTSNQQPFEAWDASLLYELKPGAGYGRRLRIYSKYSDLKVRLVRPDRLLPQAESLHLQPDGTVVPQAFNPNPNYHPDPWVNAAVEDPFENQILNLAVHGHRFRDAYADLMMNGLATNQYHWDATSGLYFFDPNTTDPVLPGGHYETYGDLAARLGVSIIQAQQRFDEDYPGIPGRNERWAAGGVDPTNAQAVVPNELPTATPDTGLPVPMSGSYAVQVPKYQPDNDLSAPLGNGHNPANGPAWASAALHHYGYLGRTYLFVDVENDGDLHIFDPVLSSPRAYGPFLKKYPNQANPLTPPPVKDDTYEDPYRVLDVTNAVPADMAFKYSQAAVNLKQFPHGASDAAQQGAGPAGRGAASTAWSPVDVENDGNVNLVALAPWHWDNMAQRWRILGTVFGQPSPFFSDNLYGISADKQPIDPHVYIPRTMLWWSMMPRGTDKGISAFSGPNSIGDLADVGKLPKAEPNAPFPTRLSGDPNNNGAFQPWIGLDIPVGQPVGTYGNPNVLLREPNPNVGVSNGAVLPPDDVSNPNLQKPADVDGIQVQHPVPASTALNLTADVEEAAPQAAAPLTPAFFNLNSFTQLGTINDQFGNDDSPAAIVQSLTNGGTPGFTTTGTNLWVYWSSNRNPATPASPILLPNLFGSSLNIPYDFLTGTFASTGTKVGGNYPLWSTPTPLASNATSVGAVANPTGLPPGYSSTPPGYLTWTTAAGSIYGMQQPNGVITPVLPATPYNQGPRLVLDNLANGLNGAPVVGILGFGSVSGRYSLTFNPIPPGINPTDPRLAPYALATPTGLTNVKDPSTVYMTGMAHSLLGTNYNDYQLVGFAGTSAHDHTTGIYASRYSRSTAPLVPNTNAFGLVRTAEPTPPGGPAPTPGPAFAAHPALQPNDTSGTAWPRIGLSVAIRSNGVGDNRHGETLTPDSTGTEFSSQHIEWAMPMPAYTVPNGVYPAGTNYTDWPQIMAFNANTNTFSAVFTPPLNPNNHWFFDGTNQVWLLQANGSNQLILTLDPGAGLVRFAVAPALPGGVPVAIRADYTPGALRLTKSPAADTSPAVVMDDSPDALAHAVTSVNGGFTWAPVSRHTMWVVWRRQITQVTTQPASTLYYDAWRLQADLPPGVVLQNNVQTGLPDVQVYAYAGPAPNLGAAIAPNLWGIDQSHNRLWFDASMEGQDVTIVENGNSVRTDVTVTWEPAMTETPLRIQGLVNEGQPSAYLETVQVPLFDPVLSLPLNASGVPTTAKVTAADGSQFVYSYPRLWVFWSSTRQGSGGPASRANTDLFYESIVPQL